MSVGRKIYYETFTGNTIFPPLESRSDPAIETSKEQDFLAYPFLKTLDPTKYDFVQLAFNERESDIQNMGSCHVNPVTKVLTIYPRLTITTDKVQITANGTDTATIKVTVQDITQTHSISFTVNNGTPVIVNTANGVATLPITTTVVGDYVIKVTSDLYGTNSITVRGV